MLETVIKKGISLAMLLTTTAEILINKPEKKGEINV